VCGVAVLVAILSLGAILSGIVGGEPATVAEASAAPDAPADAKQAKGNTRKTPEGQKAKDKDKGKDGKTPEGQAEDKEGETPQENRIAPVSWLVGAFVLDLALVLSAVSWIRMRTRKSAKTPRAWWFVSLIAGTIVVLIAGALLWLKVGPWSFIAAVVLALSASIGLFVWCWVQRPAQAVSEE